jgi:hypothetical protein
MTGMTVVLQPGVPLRVADPHRFAKEVAMYNMTLQRDDAIPTLLFVQNCCGHLEWCRLLQVNPVWHFLF